MVLIMKVKKHWLFSVIIISTACISATWFAANEILVKPRDYTIAQ